jgi:hypothetical protein
MNHTSSPKIKNFFKETWSYLAVLTLNSYEQAYNLPWNSPALAYQKGPKVSFVITESLQLVGWCPELVTWGYYKSKMHATHLIHWPSLLSPPVLKVLRTDTSTCNDWANSSKTSPVYQVLSISCSLRTTVLHWKWKLEWLHRCSFATLYDWEILNLGPRGPASPLLSLCMKIFTGEPRSPSFPYCPAHLLSQDLAQCYPEHWKVSRQHNAQPPFISMKKAGKKQMTVVTGMQKAADKMSGRGDSWTLLWRTGLTPLSTTSPTTHLFSQATHFHKALGLLSMLS